MGMRRILNSLSSPVWLYHFFHIISLTSRYPRKVNEHKIYFDFLYNFVWNISHSKKNLVR